MQATFITAGLRINIKGSSIQHEFDLTPSMPLFLDCTSQKQLNQLWTTLSDGGQALMPIGGFGPVVWVNEGNS